MNKIFILCQGIIFFSCSVEVSKEDKQVLIEEVRAAEIAFSDHAAEFGVQDAFYTFAASDGVINRKDKIIQGPEAIGEYYSDESWEKSTLQWAPTFVDVSASGDLGYTYGEAIFTRPDSTGTMIESKGIFHTVWKRQPDGTWKFVWD